jgi:hypothetical protein
VVEAPRFFDGQFDDLLGSRGQTNLAAGRLLTAADDELYCGTDFAQFDAEVVQDLGGDSVAFTHKAQEEVLGANVVVIEPLRFLLGKSQDAASSLCKLVKSVCHFVASAPCS